MMCTSSKSYGKFSFVVPRRDNNVKILVGQGKGCISISLEGKQRNCISVCKQRTIGDYAVELGNK